MKDLPLKLTGEEVSADEWNKRLRDSENFVAETITLDENDAYQMSRAVSNYVACADFYVDSGTVNNHVLSVVGNYKAPTTLRDGMRVRFQAATTNTAASTVNVAGLGVKNIKRKNGAYGLSPNNIEQNKYYELVYQASGDHFELLYLQYQDGRPGDTFFSWNPTTPSRCIIPYGQALSRTVYADLFATFGTTHGAGDGSTTFNVPDVRGRIMAGMDNLGGSSANRITSAQADVSGGVFGTETHALTEAELAAHNHGGTTSTTTTLVKAQSSDEGGTGGGKLITGTTSDESQGNLDWNHNHTISSSGSGTPHNNVQPTIFGYVYMYT